MSHSLRSLNSRMTDHCSQIRTAWENRRAKEKKKNTKKGKEKKKSMPIWVENQTKKTPKQNKTRQGEKDHCSMNRISRSKTNWVESTGRDLSFPLFLSWRKRGVLPSIKVEKPTPLRKFNETRDSPGTPPRGMRLFSLLLLIFSRFLFPLASSFALLTGPNGVSDALVTRPAFSLGP